jgi:hypothetical protein
MKRFFCFAAAILCVASLACTGCFAIEISVARADDLLAKLSPEDPWEATKDASVLAWNESYTIHALVDLYEATGDQKYLPEVVRRGDRMLSHRDDRRGFADASGKIHKRWSIASKYTIGEAVLNDDDGKPAIRLRSTLFAYNHLTKVEVKPAKSPGRFDIALSNRWWKRDERFSDLSADPSRPRYFEKIINDENPRGRPVCAPGTCTEASQLLRATPVAEQGRVPAAQSLSLTPLAHAHVGYVGIIYHPLLRFAALVRKTPALAAHKGAADRFVAAADESFEELQAHWRNGFGDDEGYYINCLPGGPEAYDGVPHAFNYLGKLTCSELLLFELTGKAPYHERATRMCNLFKHRLTRVGEGQRAKYVWNYWSEPVTTGWTAADGVSINTPHHAPWAQVEDTSHGALNVQMVTAAASAGVVFDHEDVRRMARTFVENVALPDRSGFFGHVDGTNPNSRYKTTRVNGWLSLSTADPRVLEAAREIYQNRGKDDLRDLAALLKLDKISTSNAGGETPASR